MKFFRDKLWITVFFALISLGQAYPYAATLSLAEAHQCTCNLHGHKCIHGCDLSHRHGRVAMGRGAHAHHSPSGHSVSQLAQREEKASHWVSPRCSQTAQRKLLSLKGDPFLLNAPNPYRPQTQMEYLETRLPVFEQALLFVDSPPPKWV